MIKYQPFDFFILRTPTFSLNKLKEGSVDFIRNVVQNNIFREAIYLASPDLSDQLKNEKININVNLKLQLSLSKYFTRMCVRCTPFGIFAGCSLGRISKTAQSELILSNEMYTNTQIDMNYLCFLISNVVKSKGIYESVKLFPNTSLYIIGKNYRYTYYDQQTRSRAYSLMEAEHSIDLQKLIQYVENGKIPKEIIDFLTNRGASKSDAEQFLSDLLLNQILVTEFEPKLTCGDLLKDQVQIFEDKGIEAPIISYLKQTYTHLKKIDSNPIGSRLELFELIKKNLEELNIKSRAKSIFKLDLYKNTDKCILNEDIINTVKSCIVVLNKLTSRSEDSILLKFRENFYTRYEEEEIPLLLALDAEVGIGFGQVDAIKTDRCDLLKNIRFQNLSFSNRSILIDSIQQILINKYEEFIKDTSIGQIEISDNDLIDIQEDWSDLPDTFTTVIEILRLGNNPVFCINGVGSTSAANILGRFSTLNKEIELCAKSITQKEKEINPDSILAEIVHLTDENAGNVSTRKTLREYEIPYLANSSVEEEQIIKLSDLFISVPKGKEIILRSRKLGKKIKPKLTTALNYNNYPLPLYTFLCSLQQQNIRSSLSFSWGAYLSTKSFLPRVTYKNQIISRATWNISSNETKSIPKITDINFYFHVDNFRRSRNIPQKVVLVSYDQKLLIDFSILSSIQMLFSVTKNRNFQLQEFLFDDYEPVVKKNDEQFANEILLSFYKSYE